MQLQIIPQVILFTTGVASLIALIVGFNLIRTGRKSPYFRIRQRRTADGWGMIGIATVLGTIAVIIFNFSEPLAAKFFPATTRTPAITVTKYSLPEAQATAEPNPTASFEPIPGSLPTLPTGVQASETSDLTTTKTVTPISSKTLAPTGTALVTTTALTLRPLVSFTPTFTHTHIPTQTITLTPTLAPSRTATYRSPTLTATHAPTNTITPAPSLAPTWTAIFLTPTMVNTHAPTPTVTATLTLYPTWTAIIKSSPTASATRLPTLTNTPTIYP